MRNFKRVLIMVLVMVIISVAGAMQKRENKVLTTALSSIQSIDNFRIYYGKPTTDILSDMKNTKMVIVNANYYTSGNIWGLRESGVNPVAYQNIMEVPKWVIESEEFVADTDYLVDNSGNPILNNNNYILNLQSTNARRYLLFFMKGAMQRGCTGIFVDALDDIDSGKLNDVQIQNQRSGYVQLLTEYRNNYYGNGIIIIQNRGFNTLPNVKTLIDGVMWSGFDYDAVYNDTLSQQNIQLLKSYVTTYNIKLFAFSTNSSQTVNSKVLAESQGFVYTYEPFMDTWTKIGTPVPTPTIAPTPTPTPSSAVNAYYVSTTGNDSNTGTISSPWRTIQKAMNTAKAGTTVYVRGGIYNEKLTVNVSGSSTGGFVSFESYPSENVILDGTGSTSTTGKMITISNKSYIRIKGFEIRNNGDLTSTNDPTGIYITGSGSNIEILNNKVHDMKSNNTAHGISVRANNGTIPISNLVIDGNEVYNCILGSSESVTLNGNVNGFKVTNNKIHDNNNIGIDCAGFYGVSSTNDQARNGVVSGNKVYNICSKTNPKYNYGEWCDGIYVDGGTQIIIENNLVDNSDLGIEVASEHLGKVTNYVTVRNNKITNSHKYGLTFGGAGTDSGYADNNVFVNNTLYNNYRGISVQNARNNKIENNIIYGITPLLSGSIGTNVFNYNIWYGYGTAIPKGLTLTNKFVDPKFINTTVLDFHLQSISPAINAGNPNSSLTDVGNVDFDGNKRINNVIDCGAYEYTGSVQ